MTFASEALRRAESLVPGLRSYLPSEVTNVITLEQLLEQLGAAEREASAAYDKLVIARRGGFDQPFDYVIYRKLQDEMFRAQVAILTGISRMAGPLAPGLAALLPRPEPLPSLTYARQAQRGGTAGLRGGLGWIQVAAGILAALAAVGLAYLLADEIADMIDDLTAVLIARARAAQQSELINARRAAFDACRARGGTGNDCVDEAAALVPTPAEAGTEIPSHNSGGDSWSLGQYALLGVGVLVVGAVGYGLYSAYAGPRRRYPGPGMWGYSGVPLRSARSLPARASDLDGGKSRYYLEV